MKKTVEQLQEENKQLLLQRDQWRTIAIAYLVQSEKAGVHEKVFKMLNEEQKIMVKKEVTAILAGMEKGGL